MADELHGKRIAILAADGVERVELGQPRQAFQDAGATTVLLSLHEGEIKARENDLDEAGTFSVDALVKSASADEYDARCFPAARSTPISCAWIPTPSDSCATSWSPTSRSPRSATDRGR